MLVTTQIPPIPPIPRIRICAIPGIRGIWVTLSLVLAVVALGCAAAAPGARSRDIGLVPPPELRGVVVLVHGIWPDGAWIAPAADAMREAALEPVPVDYGTFVAGYFSGKGTDRPAARLLAFAVLLDRAHAATGCDAGPLRLHAVGFSGGTVVILKAAALGATFDRAIFGGSPIFTASGDLAAALAAGRFRGGVVNDWSPVDGLVGGVLGMGQLGYWGGAPGVEDRAIFSVHVLTPWAPPFAGERGRAIAAELAARADLGRPHRRCLDADGGFYAWLRRAAESLEDEDGKVPGPPPPPSFVLGGRR